jgi:hypothetical protein
LNDVVRKPGPADTAGHDDMGVFARIAAAKTITAERPQHECRNDCSRVWEHDRILIPTRSLELAKIILALSLLLFGSGKWATVTGGGNKCAWVTHAN